MQEEDVDVNVLRLVVESGRKWSALRRKPANIGGGGGGGGGGGDERVGVWTPTDGCILSTRFLGVGLFL